MRLAVLSDIHGNLLALEAALNDLATAGGADKVWVLGDLCAFGPRPQESLQRLRDLKGAQIISGNADRYLVTGSRPPNRVKEEAEWLDLPRVLVEREANFGWTVSQLRFEEAEYLAKLPPELDMQVAGYGYVIGYHGAPGNDEYNLLPDTPDEEVLDQLSDREGRLGFGGHTHRPMDRDLGWWRAVNVGSVGMPMDEMRASYALVTFEGDQAQIDLRRVDYDVEAVIADLQQRNPSWQWVVGRLTAARG
ncbi:MAG: metallophosphoesterase family protein [Anaerolineae bacterium]|nr:metallophosphoesterase family protein [Anaerolineae bacterium]